MGNPNDTRDVAERKQSDIQHAEFRRLSVDHLAAHVDYDNKGISGIIRSPYVFGAALLASFGGFSFGYGMLRLA